MFDEVEVDRYREKILFFVINYGNERAKTVAENAKDTGFVRTPGGLMMGRNPNVQGTEWEHPDPESVQRQSEAASRMGLPEIQGTNTGRFSANEPNTSQVPQEGGEQKETPKDGFSMRDLLNAYKEGGLDGVTSLIRQNMPDPCPAAYALTQYAIAEVAELAEDQIIPALQSGAMNEARKAAVILNWAGKMLQGTSKLAPQFDSLPELTFREMHALVSLAHPEFVCEAVREAAKESGYDLAAHSAAVQEALRGFPRREIGSVTASIETVDDGPR